MPRCPHGCRLDDHFINIRHQVPHTDLGGQAITALEDYLLIFPRLFQCCLIVKCLRTPTTLPIRV